MNLWEGVQMISEAVIDALVALVRQNGPWVLFIAVAFYVLIKGRFKFEYPRDDRKNEH
jgi:hypothetical protein